MKKIYLLFSFIICIAFFLCCNKINSSVSFAIAKKVSVGEDTTITIANLTNFKWDKLYIFSPYANRESIENTIGIKFLKENDIQEYVSEGDTFLVFTKDDKVIHYFNHPRGKGDFSGYKDIKYFTPENAKFKVVHEGHNLYGKWPKLIIIK